MTRPSTVAYGELILPVFTQWEKVGSITGILSNLEQGVFYDASLLVDQMMRDDRIKATFSTRLTSVLGQPMHMEPSAIGEKRADKRAQRCAEDAHDLWEKMVPRAELMSLMKWALLLGVGIARKEWTRSDGEWLPTIKVWHPGALRFDLMTDRYMLRTQGQGEIPIERDDPNWLLVTPFGHKYARSEGLLRSLAMLYLCRQWAFRDRARNSEVHGQPIRQIIVPAESDADDKRTANRIIASLGSETTAVTPQGTEGNLFDLKLIEAQSNASEVFGPLIQHLDECIAILILGQADSTQQKGGLGAKENAGDTVRRDVMRFDAACIADLARDGVLADWAEYNYGSRDLAPTPMIEVDPPKDGQLKALELKTAGEAIGLLEKHGLDVRAFLEEMGVPLLTEAEAAAKRDELMQQAQDAMAATNENNADGNAEKTPGSVSSDTQAT
jgi:phage gp29-like protein